MKFHWAYQILFPLPWQFFSSEPSMQSKLLSHTYESGIVSPLEQVNPGLFSIPLPWQSSSSEPSEQSESPSHVYERGIHPPFEQVKSDDLQAEKQLGRYVHK